MSESWHESGVLAPNDPYNGMNRQDIRPNFAPTGNKNADAKDNLSKAEYSASANPISTIAGGMSEAKAAEQNQPFANDVQGVSPKKSKPNDAIGKRKGLFSRKGALVAIMTLLLGGGGLMVVSQSLAPFALIQRGIAEFNSNHTAMRSRSTYFSRFMMDTTRNKSLTKYGIFSGEKFKISSSLQKKLARNNIDYQEIEAGSGKKIRMLLFADKDGSITPIVTKQSDLDALPDFYKQRAALLDDMVAKNDNFFKAQEKSTRTIKGQIAGWFDGISDAFHKRIRNSRNRFLGTDKNADDSDIQSDAKRTGLNEATDDSDARNSIVEETDKNSDGEETTSTRQTSTESDALKKGMNTAEVGKALKAKLAKAATGVSLGCMILKSVGALNLALAAINIAQIVNYATGFFEAVQKTQAGEGGSELAYYMNGLTTNGTAYDLDDNIVSENRSAMSSRAIASLFDGNPVSPNDPLAQKYNVENVSTKGLSDASFLGAFVAATGNIGNSIAAFQACTIGQAALSAGNAIADVLIAVGTVGLGNIIKSLFSGIVKSVIHATALGVLQILIGIITPYVAKMLANDLITNMAGEDAGYVISSAFNIYQGKQHQASGGTAGDTQAVARMNRENAAAIAAEARYDRLNHSPFDITSENTFMGSIVHQMIPMAASISSSGEITSMVAGFGNLVRSSFTSLIPVAGAVAKEVEFVSSFNTECPNLKQFNVIGDAYCNPYYTTDYSTMGIDPAEVFDIVNKMSSTRKEYPTNYNEPGDGIEACYVRTDDNGVRWYEYYSSSNFEVEFKNANDYDDNGYNTARECYFDNKFDASKNPIINADSELGKYIIACTLRDSQLGIVDVNIQSWIEAPTGNAIMNAAVNTGLGVIPIIGDAVEIIQSAAAIDNLKWNSGQACLNVDDNSMTTGNPTWPQNKYFQRFLEDQRTLEAYELIDQSAQVAVLEKHYEEHPLDDSYEGVIAQYSGLAKENVIALMDFAEYIIFLAEYDPTGLYPMPAGDSETPQAEELPNKIIADYHTSPVPYYVVYADTRSRNFAV
ncbi:MAG: hypothetical protein LBT19_01795 [Candidatus Nomurabacteria bacterium]|jgi:hypothetical protein|nr:hypothetical protein [Candidatus Nomurabacteria bacterium]